jgi:hypothetical protein
MFYFYFRPARYVAALATLAAYWSGELTTTEDNR